MKPASSAPDLRFWAHRRLPVFLQSEAAECGLACLGMVAAYWGNALDPAGLRRRFAVSLKGSSLKGLMGMAQELSLQARPLKLDLGALRGLVLPCVLHWNMNHFVVLQAVQRGHLVVHDPAVGRRRLSLAEASRHFTGVALELRPDPGFERQPAPQRFTLRSLMGKVVGLRRGLLQWLLLALSLQVLALVSPLYLQWIVDEALVQADRQFVLVLGVGFLLLSGLQAAVGAVRSWVATVLSTSLNFQWLGNAFAHLMGLPLAFFERRHLGDIVSRFSSIQAIQHSLTTQFVEAVIDGLLVAGTGFVMLLYSAPLALCACAPVALYAVLRAALFRAQREAGAEQLVHSARQQTHFLESARGVQAVRLFGGADERRTGWMNLLAEQFNAELRIARLALSGQAARTLLFGAGRVVVVWLAALAVIDGRFSVGMLFAFLSFQDQFGERLASLVDKLFELRLLRLHGERVADIVLTPTDAVAGGAPPADAEAPAAAPSIELRGLCYRYADEEPFVLQDVNLFIPAGQCVAITGASGCGKTTLIKLLLGLMRPTHGEILVDGVPMGRLGAARVRQVVGAVMQDDPLFSGSIAENISFFEPAGDAARIALCAQMAAIDGEIAAMPMGYATLVGDSGMGLSGGQKQRILLARALYRRPSVLVLDEATSHLDLANEQRVNAAIRQMPLTRVMAAHRPDTVAMAQRVVVIEQGRVLRDFEPAPATPARRNVD